MNWLGRVAPLRRQQSATPQPVRATPAPPARRPWLTRPWEGGAAAWILVFGAVLAELAAASVTNHAANTVALPVLAAPVLVVAGFAAVQWWQVRSAGSEPASRWHLLGAAAALVTWLIWPTSPGVLAGVGSARGACNVLPTTATAECLRSAAGAIDAHNLAWWATAVLIVVAALGARRSRIAAWAAIPIAFAGCALATHYLEMLLVQYHAG